MSRFASRAQLLAGGIAAAFTIAIAAAQTASPPDFSSNFTSWAAGIGVDFTPVEGSPSPLRQDAAHPFVPNGDILDGDAMAGDPRLATRNAWSNLDMLVWRFRCHVKPPSTPNATHSRNVGKCLEPFSLLSDADP